MSTGRTGTMIILGLLLVWSASACSGAPKPKVREPLALPMTVAPKAQQYTSQGSSAFLAGRYDEAKSVFLQAVSEAPNSGEAHYNLGLALFKLGDTDAAREQFIQAANLAPGNKVIWDSPALSPYSNPDSNIPKKEVDLYNRNRRGVGGGGGFGGVGGTPR
jgi:tetratricopeptide (TPR) repeat protein